MSKSLYLCLLLVLCAAAYPVLGAGGHVKYYYQKRDTLYVNDQPVLVRAQNRTLPAFQGVVSDGGEYLACALVDTSLNRKHYDTTTVLLDDEGFLDDPKREIRVTWRGPWHVALIRLNSGSLIWEDAVAVLPDFSFSNSLDYLCVGQPYSSGEHLFVDTRTGEVPMMLPAFYMSTLRWSVDTMWVSYRWMMFSPYRKERSDFDVLPNVSTIDTFVVDPSRSTLAPAPHEFVPAAVEKFDPRIDSLFGWDAKRAIDNGRAVVFGSFGTDSVSKAEGLYLLGEIEAPTKRIVSADTLVHLLHKSECNLSRVIEDVFLDGDEAIIVCNSRQQEFVNFRVDVRTGEIDEIEELRGCRLVGLYHTYDE